MNTKTAVIIGASGLTGHYLLPLLLSDAAYTKVRILVRRPVDIAHPRLETAVVDFNDLVDFRKKLGTGDSIFCCIGTTQKKVKGNLAAYRKVDVDIPLHAAQMGLQAGFTDYLLVSAVGANAHSANFYLEMKGSLERDIAALQYKRFHTFRPSLVLGPRIEFRLKELIAKSLMNIVAPLLAGRLKKYRGIKAADIAKAMVAASKENSQGMHVHHYEDMMKLKEGE